MKPAVHNPLRKRPRPSICLLLTPLLVLLGCATAGGDMGILSDQWGKAAKPTTRSRAMTHYLMSVMADREGNIEQALEHLAEAAELEPDSMTLNLKLIRGYLYQSRFEEALALCERAIANLPEHAGLYVVLGEIYHRLERYDDAVAAFQKAIDLEPENALGYRALADLQESTNDLVAAVDICRRLVEMNPKSSLLHFQLGVNLIRIGDTEGAETALKRCLELNPQMTRARWLLGTLYLEAGRNEEAAAHLEFYHRVRPGDIAASENLAGAMTRMGRHLESTRLFAGIIMGSEATALQYVEAMYAFLLAGKPETVVRLTAPEDAPIFSAFLKVVALKQANADYADALKGLDGTEGDLDGECTDLLNGMLYRFGDEETGERLLGWIAALREEPAGAASRTLAVIRGRLLLLLERDEEAVAAFTVLLTGGEEDLDVHYYLSLAYENLGDFARTEEHLLAYLALSPDDPDVMNFLGYLYAEEGVKLDEAEKLLQGALEIDPGNPYYLDSLGWVYYRQGKGKKAIDHIRRAIYGMEGDDAVLRDHLGDAYLLDGDTQRALAEWDRAHRLDPSLEGVLDKIKRHGGAVE